MPPSYHNSQTVAFLRHLAQVLGSSISEDQAMALMEVVKRKRLRMIVSLESIERELTLKCQDPGSFNRTLFRLKSKQLDVLIPFLKFLYLSRTSQDEKSVFKEGFGSSVCSVRTSSLMRAWYHQEIKCETRRQVDFSVESRDSGRPHEEKMFLSDFVNCLLGLYGGMIKNDAENRARLTENVSEDLKPLAVNFLPLVDGHNVLADFVAEANELIQGRVNHALAGFIQQEVLRKFYTSVETVESFRSNRRHLSMREILVEFKSSAREFQLLTEMIEKARGKKGGECLSAIHELVGKETSQLYRKAIEAASRPYFDSLCAYLSCGTVDDVFQEFMISKKPNASWDKIFTIVNGNVPSFLHPFAQRILKTGKYVYAITKNCDVEKVFFEQESLRMSYGSPYDNVIGKAFSWADRTLLRSILNSHKILQILKMVVAFCGENLSDFFICLIENTPSQLLFKPVSASDSKLASKIMECLEMSKMGAMPHHNLLKIHFKRWSLENQILDTAKESKRDSSPELPVMDALAFTLDASWPVRIVLDDLAVERYQIFFRHALQIRLIHFKLTKVHSLFKQLTSAQCHLKHCMLAFTTSLSFHITSDVIHSHWLRFSESVINAQSVDELREAQDTFQHDCLVGYMINPPSVYAALLNVLDVCSKFSENVDIVGEDSFFTALANLLRVISDSPILHPFILAVQPTFSFNDHIARASLRVPSVFSLTESIATHCT